MMVGLVGMGRFVSLEERAFQIRPKPTPPKHHSTAHTLVVDPSANEKNTVGYDLTNAQASDSIAVPSKALYILYKLRFPKTPIPNP